MPVKIQQDFVVPGLKVKEPVKMGGAVKVLREVNLRFSEGVISYTVDVFEDEASSRPIPATYKTEQQMSTSEFLPDGKRNPNVGKIVEVQVEDEPEKAPVPVTSETVTFPPAACTDLLSQLAALFADKAFRQPELADAVLLAVE